MTDPSIDACVRILREAWHGWGESAHDALSAWIDWAEHGHGAVSEATRDEVAMLVSELLPTLDGVALDTARVWASMLGTEARHAA